MHAEDILHCELGLIRMCTTVAAQGSCSANHHLGHAQGEAASNTDKVKAFAKCLIAQRPSE